MSVLCSNNFNTYNYPNSCVNYGKRKNADAPIEKLQKNVDNKVDNLVDKVQQERKKKSSRTAFAVGTAVVFVTAIIALLNPSTSTKTLQKLKAIQSQAKAELESGKLKGLNKFYNKVKAGTLGFLAKAGELGNNYNNGKDILWENLCCREKKCFEKIKIKPLRKALQGVDYAITTPMKKLNDWITKSFDNISIHTVKNKYARALKKTDLLEELIKQYKNKLPKEELNLLETKLSEIRTAKKYMNEKEVLKRIQNIEDCMKNLRPQVIEDYKSYGRKLVGKKGSRTSFGKWIKDMHFFSEERLKGQKQILVDEGKANYQKLINVKVDKKSGYNEILDILKPHLAPEEYQSLKGSFEKTRKAIQTASVSEYEKYFDKKRDLMLGSAPTDVLTAGIGLGLAGISVGRGKDKEEKMHRTIAVAIPAVAAVGTSLYLTGILFTGVKNMVASGVIGFAISKICSKVANIITGKTDEIIENNDTKKEITNV